ncbi:hypothetical protein SAMN05421756_10499 [Microlunatus flavus]|uniref:Uncharacterized protein n=1 Tax=Microlunatus flavus TaxID=1036181 RepID=A0A1H9H2L3_9ACTN|nr:hypothetical protein SAMN05421756_10499 [Microlunatus flavus]
MSSVGALALGVVLSVAVSGLFAALGWGGELASQTAGASSGAAPLLVDGLRQRRGRRGEGPVARRPPSDLSRKVLLASAFAFGVLVVESAWGWFVYHLSGWVLRAARADQGRFAAVYAVLGSLLTLPVVLTTVYLLALAAGRRLREHRRRWLLLGMAVYGLVRLANLATVMVRPRTDSLTSVTNAYLVAGFVVTLPLLAGFALLGARRARRTQAAYDASVFFRRLDPADREAVLALLDDARPRRGRAARPLEEQAPAEPQG